MVVIDESANRTSDRAWTGYLGPADAIVISSNGTEHFVHRIALSTISRFFRIAFTADFNEANECRIRLCLVNNAQLRQVIDYAYTGQLRMPTTLRKTLEILDWATFLMMDELIADCTILIRTLINVDNCIEIFRFAEVRSADLADLAWRELAVLFHQVANAVQFTTLTEDEILRLLDDDQLNVPDGIDERQLMTGWIHENKDADRVLRFLDECELVRRPRTPTSVLLAIGGYSFANPASAPTDSIEVLNIREHKWLSIRDEWTDIPRAYHGAITIDDHLYVFGGMNPRECLSSMRHCDLDTMTWTELGPMHQRRCFVSCAPLDGTHFMAIGGRDPSWRRLRSAEFYSILTNQWTLTTSMTTHRSDSHAVQLDRRIFMVGGFDGLRCHRSVEYFQSDRNVWLPVPEMQQSRSGVSAVEFEGTIIVAGGKNDDGGIDKRLNSVEQYDQRSGRWHKLASMRTTRSNFGMETLEGRIYVAGGFDGRRTTTRCEILEPRANRWQDGPPLGVRRSAMFTVRLDHRPIILKLCDDRNSKYDT